LQSLVNRARQRWTNPRKIPARKRSVVLGTRSSSPSQWRPHCRLAGDVPQTDDAVVGVQVIQATMVSFYVLRHSTRRHSLRPGLTSLRRCPSTDNRYHAMFGWASRQGAQSATELDASNYRAVIHAREQALVQFDQRIWVASTRAGAFPVSMTGLLAPRWWMRLSSTWLAQDGPTATQPERSHHPQMRTQTRR